MGRCVLQWRQTIWIWAGSLAHLPCKQTAEVPQIWETQGVSLQSQLDCFGLELVLRTIQLPHAGRRVLRHCKAALQSLRSRRCFKMHVHPLRHPAIRICPTRLVLAIRRKNHGERAQAQQDASQLTNDQISVVLGLSWVRGRPVAARRLPHPQLNCKHALMAATLEAERLCWEQICLLVERRVNWHVQQHDHWGDGGCVGA